MTHRSAVVLAALTLVALSLVPRLRADAIDPATVHVGPGGTVDVQRVAAMFSEMALAPFQAGRPTYSGIRGKTGSVLGSGNIISPAQLDNSAGRPVAPPATVEFVLMNPLGYAFGPTAEGLTNQ